MLMKTRSILTRFGLILAGFMITAAASAATTDDHGNSPSTATAVTAPATIAGNLETAGDVDYFKITLTTPAVITATSSGTTDVVGTLLLGGAKNSVTEVYTDNDGAGAPNFRLSQLMPAGTHYVYVRPLVYGTLGAYSVNFTVTPPATTLPDVTLSSGGVDVAAGSTIDFGTAPVTGQVNKDFVIGNAGDADLLVRSVRFTSTAALPTGAAFPFRLVSSPATTVQPGRTTTFRAAFQGSVTGTYQGKLTLVTNDGDELFYDVNLRGTASGTLPPPEIAFKDGTTEVANNSTVDFGSTMIGTRVIKEFTIANTGLAELKITSSSLTPATTVASANAPATTLPMAYSYYSSSPPASVPAGGSATFKISLYNLVAGSYSAKLTLVNNDPDENPTVINFTGTVTPDPVQGEIGISVGGVDVPNNSTLAYGNNLTGVTVSKDLLISNTGTAPLKFTSWSLAPPPNTYLNFMSTLSTGSPIAVVTGANGILPGMTVVGTGIPSGTTVVSAAGNTVTLSKPATSTGLFSLSYQKINILAYRFETGLPLTVAAGASATARISYLPLSAGDHTATFTAYNNDLDENPYVISLTGHADVNPNPGDIALSLGGVDVPIDSTIDFGSVGVGLSTSKTIAVTNAGTGELRILSTYMSTVQPVPVAGTSVVPAFLFTGVPPQILAAGQTGNIVLNFKPTAVGTTYTSQIYVTSTDPDEATYKFSVTGTGGVVVIPAPEIGVSSNGGDVPNNSSIAMGSALTGNTITRPFVITNSGNTTLTLSGWSILPPTGTTTAQPFRFDGALPSSLAAGASATVYFTYAPLAPGDNAATIQVTTNDSDENPFKINVTAHADLNPISPDISLTINSADVPQNATLDFGATGRGLTVSKDIVIKNTGASDLRITGYPIQAVLPAPSNTTTSTAAAFFVGLYPNTLLPAGQSTTLRLSFKPTALSTSYQSAITISSNDPDEASYKLNLVGSSLATDCEIGIATGGVDAPINGSVAYGSTTVGNNVAKDFVITNSGNGALSITGWSILPPTGSTSFGTGGPSFKFEGTLPSTIAPGASATVRFTYAPYSAGDHGAILQITNSDSDEGTYKINVTGHADANPNPPDIDVSMNGVNLAQNATVDFGPVNRNITVYKDILVKNTGASNLQLVTYTFQNVAPTTGAAAFYVGSYPSSTLAPGASGTLRLSFRPTTLSTSYNSVVSIVSSDPDESPYKLTLVGTSLATDSEIGITLNSVDVPNNSTLAYGNALVGGATIQKDLVIANSGTAPLSITSWSISPQAGSTFGVGGAPFRLESTMPTTIAAGTSATVRLTFAPYAVGDQTAAFTIYNSDYDEGSYRINVTGHADANPNSPDIDFSVNGVTLPSGSTVDFGAAARNTYVYKDILVKNTGASNLQILTYTFQNSLPVGSTVSAFFLNTTPSSTLAPGASGTLRLGFRPTALGTSYASAVTIVSTDPDESPYVLNLVGSSLTVDSEIGVSAGGVDVPINGNLAVGTTVVGSTVSKDLLITNTGGAALTINSWSILPPTGSTTTSFRFDGTLPTSIAAGASATVRVTFAPTAIGDQGATVQILNSDFDEGTYKINVTAHADANPTPPDIDLSISGVNLPPNGTVDFGAVGRNVTAYKDILVKNTGVGNLLITGYSYQTVTPTGSTTTAFSTYFTPGSTLAPGASGTLRVAFKPTALSTSYSSTLTITSTDPDESPYRLNLTGTSLATDSEIGVSLGTVDVPNNGSIAYGSASLGATVTKSVTVTNTGDGPLSISSWAITVPTGVAFPAGPLPFRFSGALPTTIAAGASATVNVIYAPIAAGDSTFVLQLLNSDADEGTYRITLTGTGVASSTPPEIGVSLNGADVPSGSDVDFGATAINVAVSKSLTISNTGTGTLTIGGYYTTMVTPTSGVPAHTIVGSAPLSIAPGATGTLNLSFKPTVANSSYKVTMTIYNTDTDEGAYKLNLIGTSTP